MFNFEPNMVEDLKNFLSLYYYKILRVNLTTDSYEVILARPGEYLSTEPTLSGYLKEFVNEGGVAEEDIAEFNKMTDLEYLRNHVEGEFWFKYGHKVGKEYYKAGFILLPSVNYSEDNEECILFIKEIELC